MLDSSAGVARVGRGDLVIFDLDGTLTDSKPGIVRSVRHALTRLGIEPPDLDALAPFVGPPLSDSFRLRYGLDDEGVRRALDYYREYFDERGMYENAVYPGIPELLDALRAAGTRLLVATSKPTFVAVPVLEHFGLLSRFEHVSGGESDLSGAEKNEVIARALKELADVPRDAIVMVGDREHDVFGARANDLPCVAVTYGYAPPGELDLAQPAARAASVADLRRLLLGE